MSKILYFGVGINTFGQLGINIRQRISDKHHVPIPFGDPDSDSSDTDIDYKDISDISCGGQFTVVLLNNGKVNITVCH